MCLWTRWAINQQWTGWVFPGRPDPFGSARAASKVNVRDSVVDGDFRTDVHLVYGNGATVSKTRLATGAGRLPWDLPNCC